MIRKVNVFDLLTVLFLGLVLTGNAKIAAFMVFIPYGIEGLIWLLAKIDHYYDPFHRQKMWWNYRLGKLQMRIDKIRNERFLYGRAKSARKVSETDKVTHIKN